MEPSLHLRSLGVSFLDWWLGELKSLAGSLRLPGSGAARRRLVASPEGGGWRLERWQDGRLEQSLGLPAGGLAAAVRRLGRSQGRSAVLPLTLRLPRELVFRTRLRLPQEARANLSEIVAADLQRATSFGPDELAIDQRIVGRDAAARTLLVAVAAAPRGVLQDLRERLGLEGLGASSVDVEADDGTQAPGAGFQLAGEEARAAAAGERRALRALGLLALVLTAALLIAPLWQKRELRDALQVRSDTLQEEARLVAGLQARIEGLAAAEREARRLRGEQASNLRLLATLTELLDDDTWLLELEREGPRVRIAGYSASASALIALLEASPLFRDVAFAQPVVQDPYEQAARFLIAFEFEGGEP